MPIIAATPQYFNLQIKPDFIATTLAELDAALATYVGKYVLVTETQKIYFVDPALNGMERVEAYDFVNYRIDDAGGTSGIRQIYNGGSEPAAVAGYTLLRFKTPVPPTGDPDDRDVSLIE